MNQPRTAHAPGPWRVIAGISYDKIAFLVLDADNFDVARINNEANARLIAAAPDLLEALKIVAAQLDEIDNIANEAACKAVLAAIAKAEGQP